ncbi:MAG: YfhO family protein, partial [Bacteroidetes bacterium]|nr:YfhO family protein [Bacteroidota bacterium]
DEYVLQKDGQFRVLSLERLNQTALSRPSFHHESLGGYSAAKLRVYQDFLDKILFIPNTGMPNENALDMMNVRFIFSQTPIAGALDVEYGAESGLTIYENLDVLPRAYFVGEIEVIQDSEATMRRLQQTDFDPAKKALLASPIEAEVTPIDSSSIVAVNSIDHGPRRISFEVETDAPRLLVVSEIYYPEGWSATIDGESAPIHRANYLLRAVEIPAGKHTLEMTFNPVSYIWGKRLSLISTILVYGLTFTLIAVRVYGYSQRKRR